MTSQKQVWADRADRLDAWALSAEQKAANMLATRPEARSDIAFLTQPAYGNAAGRRLASQRAKMFERDRRAWELQEHAKGLRAKASELRRMARTNAGDATKAREAHRDGLTSILAVGDLVDSIYGVRRVVKINAKSLRIEGSMGPITIDKSLCRKVVA